MRILLFIFLISFCSCSNKPNDEENLVIRKKEKIICVQRKLNALINNTYHDTILEFRSNIYRSDLLITCDTNQIDFELEKILLESKYMHPYYRVPEYKGLKGYFEFMICMKNMNNRKEIGLFTCSETKSTAVETKRFLIEHNKIKGINVFPFGGKDFITPEEYDKMEDVFGCGVE